MKNTDTAKNDGPDDHSLCRALGSVLDRLGDKWTVMVVGLLSQGPLRFSVLKRSIGAVSQRMLTITLRGLERDGVVLRTVYPTVPPSVEYELTKMGKTLIDPLNFLAKWAHDQLPAIEESRRKFDNQLSADQAGVSVRSKTSGK